MKKLFKIPLQSISLLLMAFLFSSCATQHYVPKAGQIVVINKGSAMVTSVKSHSSIAVTPLNIQEGKAQFVLTIANLSQAPLTVFANQIAANDESGQKAKIFSAQELGREATRKADSRALSVVRNANSQSLQTAASPQQIDIRTTKRLGMVGQSLGDDLEEIETVFDTTTIAPNKMHSSLLVTKISKEIQFSFIIANEVHEASFLMKR